MVKNKKNKRGLKAIGYFETVKSEIPPIQVSTALFLCNLGGGGCGWMQWEGYGCWDPIFYAMHNALLSVF